MRTWLGIVAAALAAQPLFADERSDRERMLREFFEGRKVTVWLDMPATSKGVDLEADAPERERVPLGKVNERISENGVGIPEGARVAITKIVLKEDLIEFQLAGGGFNWFWNTSGTVSPTYNGKSRRERDLERDLKEERDPKRRRELERELREERRLREQEERRSREIAERENEYRRDRDRERALSMGSRFNLRFDKRVPAAAATPEGVMEILAPWVDFSGLPGGDAYGPPRDARDDREARARRRDRDEDDEDGLRPGMSRGDVRKLLGDPLSEKSTRDGDLHKSVAVFRDGGRKVEVTFVNGVLVNFRDAD